MQSLRSVLLLGSTFANFLALRKLQLAETSTIAFLSPIFIALLSGPLLGEWPGRARLAAIAIGFAGVVVATRPGPEPCSRSSSSPSPARSATPAMRWRRAAGRARRRPDDAVVDPIRRRRGADAAAAVVLGRPCGPRGWALMAGMGAFGAVGHGLLIKAHQLAPAAALAPFGYTQLLWMIASGWLVFGDWPPARR